MDDRNRDPLADVVPLPKAYRGRPRESKPSCEPYYGRRNLAELCARFITNLFQCPNPSPTAGTTSGGSSIPLARFIAYALDYCSITNGSVVFSALYLLQRLKMRYPAVKATDAIVGHRTFLSALQIVSQLCVPTDHWVNAGQGLLPCDQIEQAGRELRRYLDNYLEIDAEALRDFERRVRSDFAGPGPYPDYTAEALAASRRRAIRQAASAPLARDGAALVVDRGRSMTPHTPELSTSARTARPQKLSTVPQPGAFYAKPLGYVW